LEGEKYAPVGEGMGLGVASGVNVGDAGKSVAVELGDGLLVGFSGAAAG